MARLWGERAAYIASGYAADRHQRTHSSRIRERTRFTFLGVQWVETKEITIFTYSSYVSWTADSEYLGRFLINFFLKILMCLERLNFLPELPSDTYYRQKPVPNFWTFHLNFAEIGQWRNGIKVEVYDMSAFMEFIHVNTIYKLPLCFPPRGDVPFPEVGAIPGRHCEARSKLLQTKRIPKID